MIYSHNSSCTVFWVSSFYLSINIVVLYQFTVTWIENFVSKVEAWGLSDGKKVQDCDYAFGSSTTFQRRKEWIWESGCRQVDVRLHVFAGLLFALEPFHDYSLCSVCILPVVRSLQSAFYTDRTFSSILITWHIFSIFLIFPNSDRTPLCFHRPMHPKGTTLGVLLAGSAGVFIRRANVFARESAMLKLLKREGNGASQRERGGSGEREYFFLLSPSPDSFFFALAPTLRVTISTLPNLPQSVIKSKMVATS